MCDMGDDRTLSIRGARVEADPPDGTGSGLDAVATSVSLPVSAASDGTVTMVGLVGRPGLYQIALAAPARLDRRTGPSQVESL
jgi:murein DD-endopeptidase MepM/ murein hydrolase activator NlpD